MEIPLQNLVEAAVNDMNLEQLYSACPNHVSANVVHKAIYRELAVTYFMVRVNVFCRQTMEQYRQRQKVNTKDGEAIVPQDDWQVFLGPFFSVIIMHI